MNTDRDPANGQANRGPTRWSQALLYIAAAIMIFIGGSVLLQHRLVSPPGLEITGEIMPELEPIDRIEADRAALRGWNVLVVTIDTARADHLACYGNRKIETPTLDQLAREGILCANAVTPVPATLPGHASLLTGLYPYNHGARANGSFKLEDRIVTLAEMLSEQGYRTGAAISAYVLDSCFGLAQGFELYHDDLTRGVKHAPQMFRERPAELTNEVISDWLREHAREQFFCWVHYFDPHATYSPPEPFRNRYANNPYDGEIAYADHQLGELLKLLTELGVREKTLVIVTSDHGEGLGQHGEMTHSLFIYDATLHVPLILHAPAGLPGGKVINRQVSLVDVMPTILDLLGIDRTHELDGLSLLRPAQAGPRACYIETVSTKTLHGWAPLLGVRRDDYKFILAPRPEVYDLRNDPQELHNLYESRPDVAVDLHELLKGFVGDDPLLAGEVTHNLEMDEEALRKLAALGYVTTVTEHRDAPQALMDPKDGVRHWEQVQKGVNQVNTGDIEGAIETIEACLEKVPADVWARQILAGAYQMHGRLDDALETLRVAEELDSADPELPLATAAAYLQLRNPDQAEEKIQQALALRPDHPGAYLQMAQVALLRRQDEQALQLMKHALELDRGSRKPRILCTIGDFYLLRGQTEKAREAYEQALEIDAFNGEAHGALAEVLVSENKPAEALEHLQTAIRFNPVQPRALAVLGGVLSNEGNFEAAIEACEQAIQIRPTNGPAWANLGLAYRRKDDLVKAEEVYRRGIEKCLKHDALHQNLAQLLLKQGKAEEAIEEFRSAANLNPFNVVALANLGTYHVQASRHELAQGFFRRALQVKPDYAFAHKQLGLLLLARGRTRPALVHLQKSLELDPDQPDASQIRFQLESHRATTSQP